MLENSAICYLDDVWGDGGVMEGIDHGKPASSNLEVVLRDNPDKIHNLLLGNFDRRQNHVKISCVEVFWWRRNPGKESAISYVEVVWRDNPGKIRNLFPGRWLAGQSWKNPQSLTWKLSGGVTLKKFAISHPGVTLDKSAISYWKMSGEVTQKIIAKLLPGSRMARQLR